MPEATDRPAQTRHPLMAAGAAMACLAFPNALRAAPHAPPPTAQVAQDLIQCRKVADRDARLACYDRATDALETAQASGAVVVVDREQVRQIKRQAFGLNLPTLSFITPKGKDDTPLQVESKVVSAGRNAEGRWVVSTDNGAVWQAIDADDLYPEPRAGATFIVRRGAIGSFFCKATSTTGYKCRRTS